MTRLLLLCVLLVGCSGAPSLNDPGLSAKQFVLNRARSAATVNAVTSAQSDCIVSELARSLSDDEFRRYDASFVNGPIDQVGAAAAASAFKKCVPGS